MPWRITGVVVGTKVGTGSDGAFWQPTELRDLQSRSSDDSRYCALSCHRQTHCSMRQSKPPISFALLRQGFRRTCAQRHLSVALHGRDRDVSRDQKSALSRVTKKLIDIRGRVENGTDDNQDRIPFRQQYRAMGHAVRANYLYAGVADLYLEDGGTVETQSRLDLDGHCASQNVYHGCLRCAFYDGTSPDGTCYVPDSIQKVHQSYGRPYQCLIPPLTMRLAPTLEICFSIGACSRPLPMANMWTLLKIAFTTVFSAVSVSTANAILHKPYAHVGCLCSNCVGPRERIEYISCFCCPPNTLRTLCEAQDYAL